MKFAKKIHQVERLPALRKNITLTAGQKLADDTDVIEFAQRTVPEGKRAMVNVSIIVRSLTDVPEVITAEEKPVDADIPIDE